MKRTTRFLSALLCLVLLLSLSLPAAAAETGPALTVQSSSAYPGNNVTVYLRLTDPDGLGALDFDVHYDDAVLSLNSASADSSVYSSVNSDTAGLVRCSALSMDGLQSNLTLLTMSFRVSSDAAPGKTPVTLSIGDAHRASDLSAMEVRGVDGAVTVNASTPSKPYLNVYSSASPQTLQQGDATEIRYYNYGSNGFASGVFDFTYDETRFAFESLTLGGALTTGKEISSVNSEHPGVVKLSYASETAAGSGTLFTLRLRAIADVTAQSTVSLAGSDLYTEDLREMQPVSRSVSLNLQQLPPPAEDHPDLRLIAPQRTKQGSEFELIVALEGSSALAAGDFTVSYDPASFAVTAEPYAAPGVDGVGMVVVNPNYDAGSVRFSFICEEGLSADQSVLVIPMRVTGEANSVGVITASGRNLVDVDYHAVQLDLPEVQIPIGTLRFTQHPQDLYAAVGERGFFTAAAEGSGLIYRWQYSKDEGSTWLASSLKTASISFQIKDLSHDGWLYRCVVTDDFGDSIYSDPARVSIYPLPVITAQPQDFIGKSGDTATFAVQAEGDGLTYRWQYMDPGGDKWLNSTFRAASMSCKLTPQRDGRLYRCVVTDSHHIEVISEPARITVVPPPVITQQPQDVTGFAGTTATFTVAAEGENLTYRWQYKDPGSEWANSTFKTASMTCKLTAARDGRQYRCQIRDLYGNEVYSDAAVITIKPSMVITQQPQDVVGGVGTTAVFEVKVEGEGLTYQWQYRDVGQKWANSSFKTASISCKLTAARNGRQYRCLIKDVYGNWLYSDAAAITVMPPPVITQQPQDFTGRVGITATFSVAAEGDGLQYRWQYKDVGGKWLNSTFKTASMSCKLTAERDGRQYRCQIRDLYGNEVYSDAAVITVKLPPVITQQPQDFAGRVGDTATFAVAAEGDGLKYQWQYKDVGGEWLNSTFKTASMSCKLTAARDGRQYRCVITDAWGNEVRSNPAAIRVSA